jgi:hypothetical protein
MSPPVSTVPPRPVYKSVHIEEVFVPGPVAYLPKCSQTEKGPSRLQECVHTLGYEPYDASRYRLKQSLVSALTSINLRHEVAMGPVRLPRLRLSRRVRFTNPFTDNMGHRPKRKQTSTAPAGDQCRCARRPELLAVFKSIPGPASDTAATCRPSASSKIIPCLSREDGDGPLRYSPRCRCRLTSPWRVSVDRASPGARPWPDGVIEYLTV